MICPLDFWMLIPPMGLIQSPIKPTESPKPVGSLSPKCPTWADAELQRLWWKSMHAQGYAHRELVTGSGPNITNLSGVARPQYSLKTPAVGRYLYPTRV